MAVTLHYTPETVGWWRRDFPVAAAPGLLRKGEQEACGRGVKEGPGQQRTSKHVTPDFCLELGKNALRVESAGHEALRMMRLTVGGASYARRGKS